MPPSCLKSQCWTVVREKLTQYYDYFMAYVEGKIYICWSCRLQCKFVPISSIYVSVALCVTELPFPLPVVVRDQQWPQIFHMAKVLDGSHPSLNLPPPSDTPCPPWSSLLLNKHTHHEAFRRKTPGRWRVSRHLCPSHFKMARQPLCVCCEIIFIQPEVGRFVPYIDD